jgi:hypothetical protein
MESTKEGYDAMRDCYGFFIFRKVLGLLKHLMESNSIFFLSIRTAITYEEILKKSNNPQNGNRDINWFDVKIIEDFNQKN